MTQKQLVSAVAERAELNNSDAKRALSALEEVVLEEIANAQKARVGGLVQLTVRIKPASKKRTGRNPATGEQITVAAKPAMRKEGERRAQGGQPGHRGAGRELKPSDQMDEIVDHYPVACGGCGRGFAPEQQRPGGRFGRHQPAELPPISVIFSEHRTHQLRCRHCRVRTSGVLPEHIAGSPFGPRLQAAL